MISLLRIVLTTLLLASCAPSVDFEFEAKSENLSAKATITEIEFNFKDGFTKLSGDVVIKNTSLRPQNYSNMWLRLQSGGEVQESAYLDNLTSHYIDSDVVEIPPGETIELPVYWVFPDSEIEQLGDDAFVLEIRASDARSRPEDSGRMLNDAAKLDLIAEAEADGVWNADRTAAAISIPRENHTRVFVLLAQPDGKYNAIDISRIEDGLFAKLGLLERSEYERYETTPIKWIGSEDGKFLLNVRLRAWREGQRYTVFGPVIVKVDGSVIWQ